MRVRKTTKRIDKIPSLGSKKYLSHFYRYTASGEELPEKHDKRVKQKALYSTLAYLPLNYLMTRGTESVNQVTEVQKDKAEEFAKIAIDKSIGSNEISEKLKDVATQEVIDKLIPADDHQQDEYGSYSFTLGDSKTYSESATSSEEQKLVVFIDYTVGNPQFKDVKPQKIKGGVTVTEKLIDGQWKVADFEFFTR